MNRRECFGISVLFCRSQSSIADDVLSPESVSHDFSHFIKTISWPVKLATHKGYRGNLTTGICDTAPYFASQNIEIVFHVPYFMRIPDRDLADGFMEGRDVSVSSGDAAISARRRNTVSGSLLFKSMMVMSPCSVKSVQVSAPSTHSQLISTSATSVVAPSPTSLIKTGATGGSIESLNDHHQQSDKASLSNVPTDIVKAPSCADSFNSEKQSLIDEQKQVDTQPHPTEKSSPSTSTLKKSIFNTVAADNLVTIIWAESHEEINSSYLSTLSKSICTSTVTFIIIHPLSPPSPGLYRIRIWTAAANNSIAVSGGGTMSSNSNVTSSVGVSSNSFSGHDDNIPYFGPLIDGMIISRHVLGVLVRMTAVSAYWHARLVVKGNYRKP
jgi:hypothetical protein